MAGLHGSFDAFDPVPPAYTAVNLFQQEARTMKRFISHLVSVVACAALVACGGGADKGSSASGPAVTPPVVTPPVVTPPAVVLQSVSVSPATVSLRVGDSQSFVASGNYSDGSTKPLTTGVVWAVSGAALGINPTTGLGTALAVGTTMVTATVGGAVGSAAVAVVPASVSGAAYKAVAAGHYHTLAVRNDGELLAWGWNRNGQLGDATRVDKLQPTRISAGTQWKSVAAGEFHSLAIKSDGTLWAWGLNIDGQLGLGVGDTTLRTVPVQVNADTDWHAVAAGKNHSLALKGDPTKELTLWAWGRNASGQLGIAAGDTTNRYVPTPVGVAKDWRLIAAGDDHSLAIKNGDELWSWGLNADGQLGDGTTVSKQIPTQVDTTNLPNAQNKQWVKVAGGAAHTLAVRNDGSLYVWGSNANAQLGNGLPGPVLSPVRLGADNNWQFVAAGAAHSVAKRSNGTLWLWGGNASGELGNGATTTVQTAPAQLGTGRDWANPVASLNSTFVLANNDLLWGWGRNTEGQQGNGTVLNVLSPAVVP